MGKMGISCHIVPIFSDFGPILCQVHTSFAKALLVVFLVVPFFSFSTFVCGVGEALVLFRCCQSCWGNDKHHG